MKFEHPRCPLCNELAVGTEDEIRGRALMAFDADMNAEYTGETKVDWDSQMQIVDHRGHVLLGCPNGHEWYTAWLPA